MVACSKMNRGPLEIRISTELTDFYTHPFTVRATSHHTNTQQTFLQTFSAEETCKKACWASSREGAKVSQARAPYLFFQDFLVDLARRSAQTISSRPTLCRLQCDPHQASYVLGPLLAGEFEFVEAAGNLFVPE